MKLSLREKVLLIALIIVGLIYLYYTLLFSPMRTERDKLASQNHYLKSQVESIVDKAKKNSGMASNAQEQRLIDSFQEQFNRVPGDILLPEALSYLGKSAEDSQVTITSLVFTPANHGAQTTVTKGVPAKTASSNEVKITMIAKGGYVGLKAFLLKIHKAPRLYRIDTIKMQSNYQKTPPAPVAAATEDEVAEMEQAAVPAIKNEITMNVDMVIFYWQYDAFGFKDQQDRVEPGKGQENPFTI